MKRKILIIGENDLCTVFPEIANEADGWDTSKYLPGSNKKKWWKCKIGHRWEATIYDRTGRDKTGCPYCSNKKVLEGFNDLKTRYPEIAKQALGWDPSSVMPGSVKKFNWVCDLGHTWDASPNSRANNNSKTLSDC